MCSCLLRSDDARYIFVRLLIRKPNWLRLSYLATTERGYAAEMRHVDGGEKGVASACVELVQRTPFSTKAPVEDVDRKGKGKAVDHESSGRDEAEGADAGAELERFAWSEKDMESEDVQQIMQILSLDELKVSRTHYMAGYMRWH